MDHLLHNSERISINDGDALENAGKTGGLLDSVSRSSATARICDDHHCLDSKKGEMKNGREWTRGNIWSNIRFFIIPVELVSFFFVFSMNFSVQLTQQYLFQRMFLDLDAGINMTESLHCLKEKEIINRSGLDFFIHEQRRVNEYSMGTTLMYLVPSIAMTILIGPLSDRYGRKPFLFTVVAGQVISPVIGLMIVHFHFRITLFFVSSLGSGLLGGLCALISSTYSYITDITPKKLLTIRMGTLEASLFLAQASSAAIANVVVDRVNCNFTIPMWIVFSTSFVGLLICILLPESLTTEVLISKMSSRSSNKGFRILARGFKLLFWKSYLRNHLLEIWLMIIVMMLAFFNTTGIAQIILYFLHNKPLEWTYSDIGIYQAMSSIAHLLVLVIVLPTLVLLKVPDIAISFIGVFIACASCIFTALLEQTWEMYLAGIIIGFEVLVAPGLRAEIGRRVNQKDVGAVFSVVAVLQVLSLILSTIVFNELYSPDATHRENGGKQIDAHLVYWLASGVWVLAGCLLIAVFFVNMKRNMKKNSSTGFFVNANLFYHNKYGGISDSKIIEE